MPAGPGSASGADRQMTENRKQKSGMPVQISKWWRLHVSDVKAAHQDLLQITEFRLQMSGGSRKPCFSCFTFQMADCRSHRHGNVGLSAQAEKQKKQGRLQRKACYHHYSSKMSYMYRGGNTRNGVEYLRPSPNTPWWGLWSDQPR